MKRAHGFHFGFLTGMLAFIALLLVGFGIGLLYAWVHLPEVGVLAREYPVVIYRGKDEPPLVRIQKAKPKGWVSLGEISKVGQGAVIVSEDWAYFQHQGYDPNQIKEALVKDWETKKFARGASTITQQVVRNVFLTKNKTLVRKLEELYLAVELDDEVPKRRVLETYFNIAEWGEGIFGIGPAAQAYFNKSPSELTAKEGAFLAMLLPSPVRYGQSFRKGELTDYARRTIDSILGKMVQAQYLTEEEAAIERARPLSFEKTPDSGPNPGVGSAPFAAESPEPDPDSD